MPDSTPSLISSTDRHDMVETSQWVAVGVCVWGGNELANMSEFRIHYKGENVSSVEEKKNSYAAVRGDGKRLI